MAKKKSIFRGKVSANVQEQKTRGSAYGYMRLPNGVNIFQPPTEGRIFIDILPYEVTESKHPDRDDELKIANVGDLWYRRPYRVHRNVGANNTSYVCPSSIGMPCPICEYRAQRKTEGADDEELRALKYSNRNLYCIVPLKDKKFEEKPHIWDISQYLFQDKLNDELEEQPEFDVFPDLEEGYTLRIRFSEQSIGKNKFGEVSRIDFEDREKSYDESILNDVPDMDKILTILSYTKLKAAFMELEPEMDEEDPIDEEEPIAEEEEEEEKPIRKRKTAESSSIREDNKFKKRKIVEEEEEEEEEPVEEEEEKPTPKRTVNRKKTEEEEIVKPSKGKMEAKTKCPHGHTFGTDCDAFPDDCDVCDIWDACMDAKGV